MECFFIFDFKFFSNIWILLCVVIEKPENISKSIFSNRCYPESNSGFGSNIIDWRIKPTSATISTTHSSGTKKCNDSLSPHYRLKAYRHVSLSYAFLFKPHLERLHGCRDPLTHCFLRRTSPIIILPTSSWILPFLLLIRNHKISSFVFGVTNPYLCYDLGIANMKDYWQPKRSE